MSSPYALWSIWRELPMLLRLFFLILSLVSIYTLFAASIIMVRLRSLKKQHDAGDSSSLPRSLAALRVQSANTRQLIAGTFYLFGFVFFLTLPWATINVDNSSMPFLTVVLRSFLTDFAFAANVFFVFVILHLVQWFASSRVNAYAPPHA